MGEDNTEHEKPQENVDENEQTVTPQEETHESLPNTAEPEEKPVVLPEPRQRKSIKQLIRTKKVIIPAAVVLLLAILMAVPITRYTILGLVFKQSLNVTVTDSKTGKPVTEATVTLAGTSSKTDKNGHVITPKVKLGSQTLTITKKYYKTTTGTVVVQLKQKKAAYKIEATGRQVTVVVKNKISTNGLENALVKSGESEARTDKTGTAVIVLPSGLATAKATLAADGYNTQDITLEVTETPSDKNAFTMTPAGKIYFLSKKSGKIDVVKTNLDGSERQTVLAGTGREEDRGTVLLASTDWKYLALEARREGNESAKAKLYLIDTSNDKLSTIDEGNATFEITGWSGHSFVYTVNRIGIANWQPKLQALKAFNAETQKLTTLDETSADGTGGYSYAFEQIGAVYAIDNLLVYSKAWVVSYYAANLSGGKQTTIISVQTDGKNKKILKNLEISGLNGGEANYLQSTLYEPKGIYYHWNFKDASLFYEYEDGAIKDAKDLTDEKFSQPYPTYLQSPNTKQTFWSEPRDGKNTLFIGNDEGEDEKEVASLSEYKQYGWYTDDYLLVSKNDSELYILSKNGLKDGQSPFKITDYHKPDRSYQGYGGGYGGF